MAIIVLIRPVRLRMEECEQDLQLAECQCKAAGDVPWNNAHNQERYCAARERLYAAQDFYRQARKEAAHG